MCTIDQLKIISFVREKNSAGCNEGLLKKLSGVIPTGSIPGFYSSLIVI